MKKETIAVDFDGVIHDHKNKQPKKMGLPIAGAREALTLLRREYTVVIFSVWAYGSGVDVIGEWMSFHKIPFDSITNIKPQAKHYIDDKAIEFTAWPSVMKRLRIQFGV